MKRTNHTIRLFARPQDVDSGTPFHVDLLSEFESAGDYTVEYRRIDALWHDRSEQPRLGTEEILIYHLPEVAQMITVKPYFDDMDWACYCDAFDVYRWAYVEDFLPYCITLQTDENDNR